MDQNRLRKLLGLALVVVGLVILSLLAGSYIQESTFVRDIVQRFGYVGMLFLAIIGGFNLVIPIPAAAFTPIFTAAGFSSWEIIIALGIGTTIADMTAFFIALYGGQRFEIDRYPYVRQIRDAVLRNRKLVIPISLLYVVFAPYPNEVLLIPLGLTGIRARTIFIPLIIGNFIHNAILVFGIAAITQWFL